MLDNILELHNISYTYDVGRPSEELAVSGVDFQVPQGSKIGILGANGSGKSTLAKLMKALLFPQEGEVLVLGNSTETDEVLNSIHKHIGMVFQNPDNQIVGTTVEEDVAFGPENIGMPREKMLVNVPDAIAKVGLVGLENRQPSELSGGQKQKLAIAGILAMEPRCIILDEATSMLDPLSRKEVLEILDILNETQNISVINVTHHVEEIISSDYVFVMHEGEVKFSGKPAELFLEDEILEFLHMEKPDYVNLTQTLAEDLQAELLADDVTNPEIAQNKACNLLQASSTEELQRLNLKYSKNSVETFEFSQLVDTSKTLIKAEGLTYTYNKKSKFPVEAINQIDLEVYSGELLGIVGSTGSGKTSLVQHFNGLLKVQEGELEVLGYDMRDKAGIEAVRRSVGMVMQYPEDQLFAETIFEDVAFGPKQLGWDDETVEQAVVESLATMGLGDIDSERSPFALSGGQQRRVAIAGILAMRPKVLILDEPAAGLDPLAKQELYKVLKDLQAAGVTIIMISHNMNDISKLADRILVMQNARVLKFAAVKEIFADTSFIADSQLDVPLLMDFAKLFTREYPELDTVQFNVYNLLAELTQAELSRRIEME